MNNEQDYLKLLDLLFRVVEANRGPLNGIDEKFLYAEGLATKFFLHAASILYLSRQTNIPDLPSVRLKFTDPGSIDVLSRAAFETFLTFHYIFIAPKDSEEQNYRYWAWRAAGLAERQALAVSTPEHKQKLADEKKELDHLHNKLGSNATFQQLTYKQQNRVLKGEWRLLCWRNIADSAGLSKALSRDMYKHLSGYAHSGSLSILQIQQSLQNKEQQSLMRASMDTIAIATANLIRGYSHIFPKAKKALAADAKGTGMVDLWVQLGQTLDFDVPADNADQNF